jgi:hypothetical protein
MQQRLAACWKKVADHQDSFVLPDYLDAAFQPGFGPGLTNARSTKEAWQPRAGRSTMFQGWEIIALKSNGAVSNMREIVVVTHVIM